MTFYAITQNHLDIIKRDFFGAVVGVAPGCGGVECFQKRSRRCPYDSCQTSFLHKAAGGTRYSFCLERSSSSSSSSSIGQQRRQRQKPGWFVWNDINRDNHPDAVQLRPLQAGSSGGDDAMLWYTDVTKLRLSAGKKGSMLLSSSSSTHSNLGISCSSRTPCHSVWDSGTTLLALPSAFASVLEKQVAQIIRENNIRNACDTASHQYLPTIELDVPRADGSGVYTYLSPCLLLF